MSAMTKDLATPQELIQRIDYLEHQLVEIQKTLNQIVGGLTGEPPKPVVRLKRD
jgi:hypothetical protein